MVNFKLLGLGVKGVGGRQISDRARSLRLQVIPLIAAYYGHAVANVLAVSRLLH